MSDCYLVTGAMGCIGSSAVRQLVAEGERVVVLDASTDRSRFDLVVDGIDTSAVSFVAGDITDLDTVSRVLDDHGVTHVIHLAALQVPFCRADPPLGAAVNVVGTVNVFDAVAARRDRIGNVVYAGSIGMFDAADADGTTHHLAAAAVGRPRSHYGVYKQANEGTARVYWEDNGVPSVGLRPFVVYGPGRDQGLTSSPTMAILAAVLGRPYRISYGGRVQFQYARDAAAAFICASRVVRHDAHHLNLGGPVASIEDVIEAVAAAVPGADLTFDPTPLPFPESVDTSETERVLGALPATTLAQGVAETADHFGRLLSKGKLPGELVDRLP